MSYLKNIQFDKYNTDTFNFLFDDMLYNYSIKAILVAIASLIIPNISISYLEIFDNLFFKIFFIIIIALIAYKDPVMSLLLAIIFIIAIQRLHLNKLNKHLPVNNNSLKNDLLINKIDSNDNIVDNNVYPDLNEANSHPAYNTLSDNIRFTNDKQFSEAQTNIVPDSSYMSEIKTFENQFGSQGLDDKVQGYTGLSYNLIDNSSVF